MALIDFVIMTPLDEEWRIAQKILGGKQIEKPEGNITYYLWSYGWHQKPQRGTYLIVGASMGKMGIGAASWFTTTVLNQWRPKHVLLLGIAGSIVGEELPLGDVIVPEEVFGYDKAKVEGRKPRYNYRKTSHQVGALLLDRVRAFRNSAKDYHHWQEACLKSAKEEGIKRIKKPPEIHFDITASGIYVVTSKTFARAIKDQIDSRVCAVEMEGKGLFDAIHNSGNRTDGLMIRGISDYADTRKTSLEKISKNAWRRYAAGNVARLVKTILQRHPTDPVSSACQLDLRIN